MAAFQSSVQGVFSLHCDSVLVLEELLVVVGLRLGTHFNKKGFKLAGELRKVCYE